MCDCDCDCDFDFDFDLRWLSFHHSSWVASRMKLTTLWEAFDERSALDDFDGY